jgi:protein SCO1/2
VIRGFTRFAAGAFVALAVASAPSAAQGQRPPGGLMDALPPKNVVPSQLEEVTVVEHLGEKLPLDLEFVDQDGRKVKLGDYFANERPVILNLGYYGCPMLCGLVLNGLTKGLKGIPFVPGREYDVVSVTIDPKEDAALAKEKRESTLEELGKQGAEGGWTFLTGEQEAITALAEAAGFGYRWDEHSKQWAHAAVILIASPDGTISRYLYGIEFTTNDLRLGLLDASDGKIGSTVDRILLFCFHYDSEAKGYVLFARNMMKLGGGLTLVTLGTFLLALRRRSGPRKV